MTLILWLKEGGENKNSDDGEGMNSQFLNDGSDEKFEYFMKLEKEEGGVVYNGEG